ncbi:25255_t:CDS:2, partial [Gigaspora margarita]
MLKETVDSTQEDSKEQNTGSRKLSLNKLESPYYSYHVDKTILNNDSAYWARQPATATPPSENMPTDIGNRNINDFAEEETEEEFIDENIQSELETIYTDFQKCLELRDKYMELSLQSSHKKYREKTTVGEDFKFEECYIPEEHKFLYAIDDNGVYQVYENQECLDQGKPAYTVPQSKEYFKDLDYILKVISDGPAKSYAYRRLRYLEGKWNMYVLLKEFQEMADSKRVPHRDFYNVRKVDTHVHLSSCMNSKHLLRFIKSKLKKYPE